MTDFEAFDIRAPSSAEVHLQRLGRRHYSLSARGHFQLGWQGRLAWKLADSGLNVLNGFSASDGFGFWRSEFEIERSVEARDPETLDLVALANAEPPAEVAHASLERAELTRVGAYQGCLRLSVSGADSIGFLAGLLSACARVGLYPLELRVRTRRGKLDDLAYLKGGDFEVPAADAEAELQRWLSERVRGSGSSGD